MSDRRCCGCASTSRRCSPRPTASCSRATSPCTRSPASARPTRPTPTRRCFSIWRPRLVSGAARRVRPRGVAVPTGSPRLDGGRAVAGEVAERVPALRGITGGPWRRRQPVRPYGSGVDAPGRLSEMAGASSCLNTVVANRLRPADHPLQLPPAGRVLNRTWRQHHRGRSRGRSSHSPSTTSTRWSAAAAHAAPRLARAAIARDSLRAALPALPRGRRARRSELRAAFIGLSDRHGVTSCVYAVVEGVAFAVVESVSVLAGSGYALQELRVAGGGCPHRDAGSDQSRRARTSGPPSRAMTRRRWARRCWRPPAGLRRRGRRGAGGQRRAGTTFEPRPHPGRRSAIAYAGFSRFVPRPR